ncbi:uncharacterized protein TNCV_101081 [Trichonephila clavipes]|nr:uncharacterized protein TNCV_101081 [Trichonephila clavipes]
MSEQREEEKEEQKTLRKQRREACETKKGVKKLKLSSCRPKSIKSRPNSPVASNSKDGVLRCPACEEEYCNPPTEEWIQFCKCQEWWHEECSNYKDGIFICDYLQRFRDTEWVADRKRWGRPSILKTKVADVETALQRSRMKSSRKLTVQLGMSHSSACRTARKLNF